MCLSILVSQLARMALAKAWHKLLEQVDVRKALESPWCLIKLGLTEGPGLGKGAAKRPPWLSVGHPRWPGLLNTLLLY